MAKSTNKTQETTESVTKFINTLADEDAKKDCHALLKLMADVTGHEAKMWGSAIIGFGSYHYQYDSGREGDAPLVAFSPRKSNLTLYLSAHFEHRDELLSQLGKHKTAKACIYIKKLSDVKMEVLRKMIALSVKHVQSLYPKK